MTVKPMTRDTLGAAMQAGSALVSTEWLHANLSSSGLRVVDATQFLPGTGRDPYAEFLVAHIPGAVFFDLSAASDPHSALPNTMPTASHFAQLVGNLGIGNDDFVVVYDTLGIMSASRVWWMFRAFGHENVAVLDGGMPRWNRHHYPTEAGASKIAAKEFEAEPVRRLIKAMDGVELALGSNRQIIDARSAARFEGRESEPRPGLRSGHIPGSMNVPYTSLLDPSEGTVLRPDELKERFSAAGIELGNPVICTCGSGVSACVVALALHELGVREAPVYDGSWSEWGADLSKPIETGPHQFIKG